MSKETYFEMCETLNSEPIPEEIPIDESDLSWESLQALECYGMLSESWASTGSYLGKNMADLSEIMKLNNISEEIKEYIISTILYIDKLVSEDIARKQKQAMSKK